MKRKLTLLLLVCSMFLCAACGVNNENEEKLSSSKNKGNSVKADIAIEEIDWSVSAGTVNGVNYVTAKVSNNSEIAIKSIKIEFTEKKGISKQDKDAFYADIQESQGFDDAWMQEYIESRETLNQPISMYFNVSDGLEIGETKEQVKCYYMGGWTSKNVIYPDLFVPNIATIEYEKDGEAHTQCYNFESEIYEIQ